jgi:hypothetical protein
MNAFGGNLGDIEDGTGRFILRRRRTENMWKGVPESDW